MRFTTFLIEKKAEPFLKSVGTMTDTGTKGDEYHGKYFGEEAIAKHGKKFVLAYDHPELGKAGSEHSFDQVEKRDGKYYAIVKGHEVRVNQFHKPGGARVGKTATDVEESQIGHLSKAIEEAIKKNGGKPIPMLLNGKKEEVAGIKRVEGETPKADAYTVDSKGKPNHWMSLKDDTFQQWGGVGERSLGELANHPDVQNALGRFTDLHSRIANHAGYLPVGTAYHIDMDKSNLEHRRIINLSTYGQDFGKEYGKDNVHAVYGGNTIDLEEQEHPEHGRVHVFKPKATYVNTNDDKADTPDSKFQLTNRSGARTIGNNGRVMVAPQSFMTSSRDVAESEKPGYKHTAVRELMKAETAERNKLKKDRRAEERASAAEEKVKIAAEKAKVKQELLATKVAARAKPKEKKASPKKAEVEKVETDVAKAMSRYVSREKIGNDGTVGGVKFDD